jgi:hypothetical protein
LLDLSKIKVIGMVKIEDNDTGEVLVDKENAIHFGNMSSAIANALVGDENSFITYMAFGNNGTTVSGSQITYKPARVSSVENLGASLYSTTFIRKLTNSSSDPITPNYNVTVPLTQTSASYKDIVATVLLDTGDGNPTGQDVIDNATDNTSAFVFDEIGMYAGQDDALVSTGTSDLSTIASFINDSSTKMLTHVIFHPVQKSQNRSLKITYTIRIQMGEL